MSGKHIRYVIERKDNADEVIGREGHMNITPDGCDFAVTSGIETLFQVKIEELKTGELLSHDGVILEGYDQISGKNRTVIAYYKYFR